MTRLPPLTLVFTSEHGVIAVTFYEVHRIMLVNEHDATGMKAMVIDGPPSDQANVLAFKLGEHRNNEALLEWQKRVDEL